MGHLKAQKEAAQQTQVRAQAAPSAAPLHAVPTLAELEDVLLAVNDLHAARLGEAANVACRGPRVRWHRSQARPHARAKETSEAPCQGDASRV